MSNTLAFHLNQVLSESGFQKPDQYFGNDDQNVLQIIACAQACALEIVEEGYQLLRVQGSQLLTSATTYALPSDFLSFVPNTMYQAGRWDPVDFPTTEETWALLNSVTVVASLPIRVRILGGQLAIKNPQAGATLDFEYISNAPINSAATPPVAQKVFAADTDVWLLDDRLFQLECKWRFKREKGLEWQSGQIEAENRRATVRGRDQGSGAIVPMRRAVFGEPYANLWVTP
jgi:hypothetical protein